MARAQSKHITFPPELLAALEAAGVAVSAYVNRTVAERWRDWQEALRVLADRSWTVADLELASSALNGVSLNHSELGDSVAAELKRAGVDAAKALAPSRRPELCWAILVAAREWWAENPDFEKRAKDALK